MFASDKNKDSSNSILCLILKISVISCKIKLYSIINILTVMMLYFVIKL